MIYLVVPTINGEINGDPLLFKYIDNVIFGFECTVYSINLVNGSVFKLNL